MSRTIQVKMHQGHVLLKLAATYSDLHSVTLEIIQNSIDSKAKKIRVIYDAKNRSLVVRDDGTGATFEQFTKALESVYDSRKNLRDQYGRFGLGLISPLSVSQLFYFTSCGKSEERYVKYIFDTQAIGVQSQVSIPSSFVDGPGGESWWQTEVRLNKIIKDRKKGQLDPETLARAIVSRYGEAIRRRDMDIEIDSTNDRGERLNTPVIAPEFAGKKLGIESYTDPDCGGIEIRLYISPLTQHGRKGEILFGDTVNPSRITAREFVKCAEDFLPNDVGVAILSGTFEGEILGSNIKLHQDRKRFEVDDALTGLCIALEKWYKNIGKAHAKEASLQADDNRFQQIGVRVMGFVKYLLRQRAFSDVLERVRIGTTGNGHANLPKGKILGKDDGASLSGNSGTIDGKKGDSSETGKKVDPPKKDHPKHSPGIVYGNKGKIRTEVKGDSIGIRFAYMGDIDRYDSPFSYDRETGTLFFNTESPGFGRCQEKDEYLIRYHIAIVMAALQIESYRDSNTGEINPELERFAIESIQNQVFAITEGTALLNPKQK